MSLRQEKDLKAEEFTIQLSPAIDPILDRVGAAAAAS